MKSITVTAETNDSGSGVEVLVNTFVDCGITGGGAILEPGIVEPGIVEEESFSTIPDDCALLSIDTSLSFEQIDQLMPGSVTGLPQVQRVGWRVRVDGTDVPPSELLNQSVTVSRSLDRSVQVGHFSTLALDGRSPLGDPAALGAPLTGLKSIDMVLAYQTPGGANFEEPLITNGIAQSSSRSVGAGIIDLVDVADGGWRFVNGSADLNIPPGSRVSRNELIRKMAAAQGIPRIRISGFRGRVSKEVRLVKSDGVAAAQGQAEVEGGRLLWNRRDEFVAKFDAPERPLGPVRWIFRPQDIISSVNGSPTPMTIDPAADAWTSVSLRGTQQVEAELATCGKRTFKLPFTSFSVFAQRVHPLIQQPGGSLNVIASNVPAPFSGLQLKQKTTTFVTRECEEIVATRSITQRPYNLKKARFIRDGTLADLPITSFRGAFVDDANSGIGYEYSTWKLTETERVNESREFDSEGFLVREVREVFSWYIRKTHQKQRTGFDDPWETATALTGTVLDLGDRQMVADSRELFVRTERREILYTNDGGYLRDREQVTERFARRPGTLFLYHDGEFGESPERFQDVETIYESWEAVAEGLVRYSRRDEGIDGELIGFEPGTITLGTPPAAVKRTNAEPDPSDFDTPEEFEAAVAASRFEQRTIRAECTAPALLKVRPVKVLENVFWENAETEKELELVCTRVLLFGMGFGLTWTVPANARIEEGDTTYVQGIPGSGIDHRGLITEVTHDGSPLGPITTVIRAIFYPDRSFLTFSTNPGAS